MALLRAAPAAEHPTMQTDIPLHEIFTRHPEWIADAMNEPFPEPCTFSSPVIKRVERRLDGLVSPIDQTKPLRVIEFQFYPDDDIYYRAVEERIAVHRMHPGRTVEAIILFAGSALDKRPEPWTTLVKAMYLDQEMVVLAQRYPQHPLPKLLGPVFEKDETKLENEARLVYEILGAMPNHSQAECEQLQAIYTSLIFSRFETRTYQEITTMLTTLDITKTRAGRDLIAMGAIEGEARGEARGKAATLLKLLSKRFGSLPAGMIEQIQHMNYVQLELLDDQVLDTPNLAKLAKWLEQQKK